jgi:hypothetical protein
MPRVGFEHTIPAFKRGKTVHVVDRAATVFGITDIIIMKKFEIFCENYRNVTETRSEHVLMEKWRR